MKRIPFIILVSVAFLFPLFMVKKYIIFMTFSWNRHGACASLLHGEGLIYLWVQWCKGDSSLKLVFFRKYAWMDIDYRYSLSNYNESMSLNTPQSIGIHVKEKIWLRRKLTKYAQIPIGKIWVEFRLYIYRWSWCDSAFQMMILNF